MRALYPVIPVALALLVAGAARAEGVTIALNHAQRLEVRGSAANVVVGNPAIADVTVLSSHTLYIVGRGYGSTDILVTDAGGRPLYSGDVIVGRPVSSVALYRGVDRADYACAPNCNEATPAGGSSGKAASSGGGSAPPASAPPTSP